MRKSLLFLIITFISLSSLAQPLTYQQKLYYTGKVWGFVKYYHSNVSNCNVNWDSVLTATLPLVKAAGTNAAFNDALDTMLAAAGPMAIATTPLPDTLPAELKRNRNFGWISDPVFRTDVQTALDTIKNNFRPQPICWVENNTYTTTSPYYGGWLIFPHDTVLYNSDVYTTAPDEYHRALMLFKHWNIINYFDPYTYVYDKPIDTILYNAIPDIVFAANYHGLYKGLLKMTSQFDDAHVEELTYSDYDPFPYRGYYFPKLVIKYIENKYVAVLSGVTGINKGDVILSIDGLTPTQWEDSLRPYMSDGNPSVFRRDLMYIMLSGGYGSVATIQIQDSTAVNHTVFAGRNDYLSDGWFPAYYYPADSLNLISWTTMGCNTGYINIGNFQNSEITDMYNALYTKPAIIIDLRNYPYDASSWQLADIMYPKNTAFSKFTVPDVTYPGTFYWYYDALGVNGSSSAYKGKIIILVNQETQSSAEFCSMIFRAMPNAIVMGSQTAGTDGNVTFFRISQDLHTGFTTLGIYYPNGDSTERIGIMPDSVVMPTIAGIRHGEDEVLNRAIAIGCTLGVPEVNANESKITMYPNPANEKVNVAIDNAMSADATVSISDISGKVLMQKDVIAKNKNVAVSFDIKAYPAGVYLVNVQSGTHMKTMKLTKL
ncbi:MAG: T9SS type A sorting domain-containing protein [Bacteroidetes bacterium]|nr:T9SS type A sorting domain-containing protein [Bacteroidota bacterium]